MTAPQQGSAGAHGARSATILGLQWGDEGKGKILDAVGGEADVVVRYQGGGNAGHTVVVDGTKYVFHHVPTGLLHPGVLCVIGPGTVVDLAALVDELRTLEAQGVDVSPVRLSDRAHVVLPYHKALDEAREGAWSGSSEGKIGTTKRGIGPTYADKAARMGIRVADLFDEERLTALLRRSLSEKNALLRAYGHEPLELEPVRDGALAAARLLSRHVADTSLLVREALGQGKRVLFEGAQGIMLDIDHGTYPFVTSSSASSAGVAAGAGVPPRAAGRVLGVAKAYTTRVGAGPFPTELRGPDGDRLRELGREYGATTGRPRRCGWLDLVQLRHAVSLAGVDGVVLTKLDTLVGYGPLKVAVAYERDAQRLPAPPATDVEWEAVRPVYEELPELPAGTSLEGETLDDIAGPAREYVRYVEDRLGVPVVLLSTGPDRRALLRAPGFQVF